MGKAVNGFSFYHSNFCKQIHQNSLFVPKEYVCWYALSNHPQFTTKHARINIYQKNCGISFLFVALSYELAHQIAMIDDAFE